MLYGNQHNPRHTAFTGIPQIKLDSVHVNYYGFGDVWGTEFLYPHPLLRPATSGEESKELQEPQFTKWCAAPPFGACAARKTGLRSRPPDEGRAPSPFFSRRL